MSRRITLALAIVCVAPLAVRAAPGDDNGLLARGAGYLKKMGTAGAGESALAALALLKADVPATDAGLSGLLATVQKRFPTGGGYDPERSGGQEVYEAAVCILALANHDPTSNRPQITSAARYLLDRQKANGSWDYDHREAGDTSFSQYAVLGLWEAEVAGVDIPPRAYDRAAAWFLAAQSPGGSWNYHRDEGGAETLSMTAAGTSSLLICGRQLERHRKRAEAANPLLVAVNPAGQVATRSEVNVPASRIDQAARKGASWISRNFKLADASIYGQTPYYALYGIERIGALANAADLGGLDWFEQGRRFIVAGQRGDGAWYGNFGEGPNTAWAMLFLTKSTAKTLLKVERARLGAGTLLGGRGLPKDLSSLTVAQGRVVVRPMNGAVEGMLAVLEDPRVDNADSALAGLVARYRSEGPTALKPHQARFLKLIADPDPGVRKVAAWGLARGGDLDAAPALIAALRDPDEAVVGEARVGLQLLSRKIDDLGPPSPSTPEQRDRAAKAWRAWYDAARPVDLDGQAVEAPVASEAPR